MSMRTARRNRVAGAATAALAAMAGGSAVSSAAVTSFPGANGRIVFATHGDDNDIWSIDPDGTGAVDLTRGRGDDQTPSVSADGKRIVFESFREGGSGGGMAALFTMNADGSGIRRLTPTSNEQIGDITPGWAPNGRQIVFSSLRPGGAGWHLWVINADGSGMHQLTEAWGTGPAWSPDGRRIVYVSIDPSRPGGFLAVMNSDGTGSHRITTTADDIQPEGDPAWSPDGKRIVFGRFEADWRTTNHHNLYVIGADGGGERQLTTGVFYDANPAWSPDGTRIVFQRQKGTQLGPQLYTVKADGSDLERLAGAGSGFTPDWSVGTKTPPGGAPPTTGRPTLEGVVTPSGGVSLTGRGQPVTKLPAGSYRVAVTDRSRTRGFLVVSGHARRVLTDGPFVGRRTLTLKLTPGTYSYLNGPQQHATTGNSFRVF